MTPGPGAYAQADASKPRGTLNHFSAFASKTERFYGGRRKKGPGPGQYKVDMPWTKNSFRVAPQTKQRPVTWVRVATAPSIPTWEQSFGYEETAQGDLVMQRPPAFVGDRTGTQVGPGMYEIPGTFHRAPARGGFGASRSKRLVDSEPRAEAPGPGSYAPEVPPSDAERRTLPSSVFLSRVERDFDKAPDLTKATPGPGAYPMRDAFRRSPTSETSQHFGSTAHRPSVAAEKHQASDPARDTSPGPGAYDDPRTAFRTDVPPSVQPFATAAPRFREQPREVPGPGAYEPKEPAALMAEPKRTVPFGSQTDRFDSPDRVLPKGRGQAAPQPPGPGAYSDHHEAPVTVFRRLQPSAAFASAAPRLAPVVKAEVPAPGQYEVAKPWVDTSEGAVPPSAAFRSRSPRLGREPKAAEEMPGPGTYEPSAATRRGSPARVGAAMPKSPRFAAEKHVGAAPGPGYYDGGAVEGLVKRSFNVTIQPPFD